MFKGSLPVLISVGLCMEPKDPFEGPRPMPVPLFACFGGPEGCWLVYTGEQCLLEFPEMSDGYPL